MKKFNLYQTQISGENDAYFPSNTNLYIHLNIRLGFFLT